MKLSTLAWWPDTTRIDLGVADACTDEIFYAAMDWLAGRQEAIEKKLAAIYFAWRESLRMALFDSTSAWVTGS